MTTKDWEYFFYCETPMSLNIGKVFDTITLYVSIKGRDAFLFVGMTCDT